MKQFENYIYLPSVKVNDILNTGNNITGKMLMTKKYILILPDKTKDAIGITNKNLYDFVYFDAAIKDMENIDLVAFETEMISGLSSRYVIPFTNLEKFEINVGFMFFGGIRYKIKGEKIQSAYVGNKANRKMIKEFYEKVVNY
jgi:hypothetical protein